MKKIYFLFFIGLYVSGCENKNADDNDWPEYGGNKAGNRYSSLAQINKQNVQQLRVAWTYDTAEDSARNQLGRNLEIQCQPIMVNGVLYGLTPLLKLFALDAFSGKELWKFNPFENREMKLHQSRGVAFWQKENDKRILYTAGSFLYSVDAATGKPVPDFGDNGVVDLHEGLSHDSLQHDVRKLSVTSTSPGIIFRDNFIVGSSVSERGDAAPGYIRSFDVITGKLKWVFRTIPLPNDAGYDTWQRDSYKRFGGANNWAGMVVDEKRGAVYFGTGSPSSDFYGGEREGKNLYANCIISLDAATGRLNWYYQTVHHDLWDRDIPCQPNLVTVKHGGKTIDAVAQSTKDGLIFVLDRDNGKSLFEVEERKVPTTGLPGEKPFPTQKFPVKPAPFSRQVLTPDQVTDRTAEANTYVMERLNKTRAGDKFMPPSTEGTLFYGIGGGAEWGGNATDQNGILYQNANEMVWDITMADMKELTRELTSRGNAAYLANCASCHGVDRKGSSQEYPELRNISARLKAEELSAIIRNGRGRMPSFQHLSNNERNALIQFLLNNEKNSPQQTKDSALNNELFPYVPPYVLRNGLNRFFDPDGYPAIKPPWGTLNAIDLNTGEYLWKIPLGEFPELTKRGIPITGTENYGGPIVTAGGLVFIAATKDERIRAFDKNSGKIIWEYQLPAGGFATPITYMSQGKQFVVIAAGGVKNGHKPGGKYIAFSLP